MNRWGVTLILMLAAPFVFTSEIQALCMLLDAEMDAGGKFLTILCGCMCSGFIGIVRHG
jgi:hypothetical protein